MSFLPVNELPALFPHVVEWISYLEKQAQESGRALTSMEINLAQTVGVARPKMLSSTFCRVFLGQRRGGRRLESMGTGGRCDGGLKTDRTKPPPRAWPMCIGCRLDLWRGSEGTEAVSVEDCPE